MGIPFLQSIIDSENMNGLSFVNYCWVNYLIRDNIMSYRRMLRHHRVYIKTI